MITIVENQIAELITLALPFNSKISNPYSLTRISFSYCSRTIILGPTVSILLTVRGPTKDENQVLNPVPHRNFKNALQHEQP